MKPNSNPQAPRISQRPTSAAANPLKEPADIKKESLNVKGSFDSNGFFRSIRGGKFSAKTSEKNEPWQDDYEAGSRIYTMIGTTTVSKVNRKVRTENQQVLLQRLIMTLLILMIIAIISSKFIGKLDPTELKRLAGQQSGLSNPNQPVASSTVPIDGNETTTLIP